eukprot:765074-Hanusia_phi.AAC.3
MQCRTAQVQRFSNVSHGCVPAGGSPAVARDQCAGPGSTVCHGARVQCDARQSRRGGRCRAHYSAELPSVTVGARAARGRRSRVSGLGTQAGARPGGPARPQPVPSAHGAATPVRSQ